MKYEHLESIAVTDVGRRRSGNEDAVLAVPAAGVFCVADGMGGAAAGEIASAWTVEAILNAFRHTPSQAPEKAARVRQAVNDASRRIARMAADRGLRGSGSTVVTLCFDDVDPRRATALHAGDSRLYRLRGGRLEQITKDHSLAEAVGIRSERQLPAMFRGVVTRAVGLEEQVEMDTTPVDVAADDLFLLCSDGLCKMIADKRILKVMESLRTGDLALMARQLIEAANEEGGIDNISVVLVRVADKLPAVLAASDEAPTVLHRAPGDAHTSPTAQAMATPQTADHMVGHTPSTLDGTEPQG
jgi:PPM family protein phosphatase